METFGYNLKDNFMTIFRNEIVNNIHFGYSTRSNTEWGSAVLLYVNSIAKANAGDDYDLTDIEIDGYEYFMTFFDEDFNDNHIFKVIKAGKFTTSDEYVNLNSNWILIEKLSKSPDYFNVIDYPDLTQSIVENLVSVSFESLLSEQSDISKNFKLYKFFDNNGGNGEAFYELTLSNQELSVLRNVENSLYNSPMSSKLISIGNTQINSTDFLNLKFVTNIYDGSYSKCYNLSLITINKIKTNELNLSNITFELVNDYGIKIISGLVYKSMIQISKIDYALIFEYATQSGSKNIVITTENFIDNDGTEQVGIFMDSNLDLVNTNSGLISPIDSNLVFNLILKNSLTFDYDTMITETNSDLFFKYMLNTAFISHNKVSINKIYFITKEDMSTPGWGTTTINDETYYIGSVTNQQTVADYYNIRNLMIEIDLNSDFQFDSNQTYDMYRDVEGYKIHRNISQTYSMNSLELREIILYYNNSGTFTPIYYSRINTSLNGDGNYKFKIIL